MVLNSGSIRRSVVSTVVDNMQMRHQIDLKLRIPPRIGLRAAAQMCNKHRRFKIQSCFAPARSVMKTALDAISLLKSFSLKFVV